MSREQGDQEMENVYTEEQFIKLHKQYSRSLFILIAITLASLVLGTIRDRRERIAYEECLNQLKTPVTVVWEMRR